ncbi:MAG: hypothetical protein O6948_12695, partial [Deltaproteobacteria bacterium]|nr:hypothetical protein [Deltaproteobacteria bacterium]
ISPEEQAFKDRVLRELEQEHGKEWLETNQARLELEFEAFLDSGLLLILSTSNPSISPFGKTSKPLPLRVKQTNRAPNH